MLREMLKDLIARQADMQAVGEEQEPVETLLAVSQTNADVVILELPESRSDPGVCSHLLAEHPDLLVLALSPGCESAFLYRQSIIKEPLLDLTDEGILTAIRKYAQENG